MSLNINDCNLTNLIKDVFEYRHSTGAGSRVLDCDGGEEHLQLGHVTLTVDVPGGLLSCVVVHLKGPLEHFLVDLLVVLAPHVFEIGGLIKELELALGRRLEVVEELAVVLQLGQHMLLQLRGEAIDSVELAVGLLELVQLSGRMSEVKYLINTRLYKGVCETLLVQHELEHLMQAGFRRATKLLKFKEDHRDFLLFELLIERVHESFDFFYGEPHKVIEEFRILKLRFVLDVFRVAESREEIHKADQHIEGIAHAHDDLIRVEVEAAEAREGMMGLRDPDGVVGHLLADHAGHLEGHWRAQVHLRASWDASDELQVLAKEGAATAPEGLVANPVSI